MKYTDEQLAVAVSESESVMGVLRYLGIKPAGGSHSHISRRIAQAGLDTSHLKGKAFNKGRTFTAQRRTSESVLVKRDPPGYRQKSYLLRRALMESGVPYTCSDCSNTGEWRGNPLTLQVDHKNEDWLDDRQSNLQFLCPNCHSVKTKN